MQLGWETKEAGAREGCVMSGDIHLNIFEFQFLLSK